MGMNKRQYKFFEYQGHPFAYLDFGNPGGFPILIQHGMVASIADTYLFDRLVRAGAYLISIARPGYGSSFPYRMETIAEWGEIVAVLVDQLKLASFDLLGMSSGAPYSYSIACRFSNRVRRIYIFSGIPALYDPQVAACWPHPLDPDARLEDLQALARDIFFSNLPDEASLGDDVKESIQNHCFGPALDLQLRCRDWGFKLQDVRQPVLMQHSRTDNLEAAELTARLLPDCKLELRSGDHFSVELLDQFLKQVADAHLQPPV